MLAGLDTVRVGFGTDDQIWGSGTIEQLRDSFVRIGMAQHVRLEVGAVRVGGRVATARGGVQLVIYSGDDKWILIRDRVRADLFDHLERQRAVLIGEALEANHPAPRPDFVGVVT